MTQIAERDQQTHPLAGLLEDLERHRFFGSLELKLEASRVVLIRKTETLKPSYDRRDNRGIENEHKS
jgi:hypothetical protein